MDMWVRVERRQATSDRHDTHNTRILYIFKGYWIFVLSLVVLRASALAHAPPPALLNNSLTVFDQGNMGSMGII